MRCKGVHCAGCGHGGGAGLAVIVALIVIAAIAKLAARAAVDVVHVLAVALEVTAITVAAAAALGVACLLVRAGIKLWRWRAARAAAGDVKAGIPGHPVTVPGRGASARSQGHRPASARGFPPGPARTT